MCEQSKQKKGIIVLFQMKIKKYNIHKVTIFDYHMHEKVQNNIHRVPVAKWLEYCAPARELQVRSTWLTKFPLSSYSQTWCKPNSIYLKRQ